jgi:hypothetical protein
MTPIAGSRHSPVDATLAGAQPIALLRGAGELRAPDLRMAAHWQTVPGAVMISRVIAFDCEPMPSTV